MKVVGTKSNFVRAITFCALSLIVVAGFNSNILAQSKRPGNGNGNYSSKVNLLSFDVRFDEKCAFLQWTSTGETGLAFYMLERSGDGINFSPLAKVNAGNNPEQSTFSALDRVPLKGVSYYRIKRMDDNGIYEIFNPVALIIDKQHKPISHLKETADLLTQMVGTNLTDMDHEKMEMEVIDMNGKVIYIGLVPANSSFDICDFVTPEGIKDGVYTLRIINQNDVIAKKLIVAQSL